MKRKVCVIGAGIIGLTSALTIQENVPEVEVTIVADTFTPNTTSDGSGGFWQPHLLNQSQSEKIRQLP
ncbi:hypothetical protein KUTeg_005813 [Tegillarca granosa]|uniref:FAD dependent oxidoreductase domain-containing protein n=1 Tax=Tegillarca granosa TaxID=220873 RepID=A0ABQ9FH59_TEGGR|nr:hypothetical protein KUTeg_005813 [Tegillarca granosa]